MDEKDLFLLSCLRQNARYSLTKLSRKTGIPVSTIFQKIKVNFNKKIIRHVALIDFVSIGYTLKAYLLLKVKKSEKEELVKHLDCCFNVNNMYKINNGWDVLVEVVFPGLCSLEEFIENLDERFGLKGKEVHYVLADLKRESFLANPDTLTLTS